MTIKLYSLGLLLLLLTVFNGVTNGQTKKSDIEWRCFLKHISIMGNTNVNSFQFNYTVPFEDSIPPGYGTPICKSDTDLVIYKIPVEAFTGNNSMMLQDFRELLKYREYPVIQVEFDKEVFRNIVMGRMPDLSMNLTLAGVTNKVVSNYTIKKRTVDRIYIEGYFTILLTKFKLEPPEKLFGMIHVSDPLWVHYNITLFKKE
jgi:hypothetical protein